MSESINEQRCGRENCTGPHRAGVHGLGMVQYDCPGSSVATPPAQDEQQRCNADAWPVSDCGDRGCRATGQCTDIIHRRPTESALSLAAAPSVSTDHTDEAHCATCHCGRRAPVQRSVRLNKPAGSISWAEHLKAWEPYGARYSQSAERIAERGGFSYGELVDQLGHEPTTWLPIGAGS